MRANRDGETFDYKFRRDGVSSAGHAMRALMSDHLHASN